MIKSNFLASIQKIIDKLDTNTLKNVLLEIIEENDNLKNFFNSMKEAVIVFDDDFNIYFFNKMAVKILEIKNKIMPLTKLDDIIKDEYFLNLIKNSIEKKEKLDNFEYHLDFSSKIYISVSLHPFVQKGKITGNILVIEDISENIENKNRLRQAESLAALTTISAGIAHEIKNPLGAISLHIQLMESELKKDKNLSENINYSLNIVKEEINRLNNIIDDYLMTVRPLNSQLILVDLNKFLDSFIDFIKPELSSFNIKIIKDYKELPEVWLDEKYFRQALLNLIKNSVQAIKVNGEITVKSYKKNNYVFINIIDNGQGIPVEDQSKIFDPYFTTKSTGTGLGLTIVYKIIKDHKGIITFSSNNGETVFSIRLPLSFIKEGLIEYSGESNGQ